MAHLPEITGQRNLTPSSIDSFQRPTVKPLNGLLISRVSFVTSPLIASRLKSKCVASHIFFHLIDCQSSEVMFAYAVSVGEKTYCVEEQSAILVTTSDELNIVIPSPNTSTADYLDINISQIEEIKTEIKVLRFQSHSSPSKLFHVLTIYESKSSEKAYYFNARGFSANSINLVFTSAGAASTVQQSILGISSRICCDLGISRSEPIDVSQHLPEDSEDHSAMQLATQLSEELSNNLLSTASPGNETYQENSPTSAAHLSLPECDESLVECIPESQPKTSVASPRGAHSPQLMTLIDGAISPLELHQFDELSLKLMTVEYNFEDTSDDGSPIPAKMVGYPALLESGQAIWDRQRALMNSYDGFPVNGCSIKTTSIEQDDHPSSAYHLRTSTHTTRKNYANQASSQPYEAIDQGEVSRSLTPPGVNVAKLDRQGLPKLTQRMRRNVGDPPVGLSTIHERMYGDATKVDKRRREDPRPALKKNVLSPDRQSRVYQNKSQTGGTSKAASSDKHDRCRDEFDFPTSAKKAPKAPTAHLATPIVIMSAQNSLKSAKQPKTKPMHPLKPPPKPMTKCSSTRPLSPKNDGGRPKASTGTTKSIPSKRTRNNDEDDTMDQTNWTDGLLVDQVKESELPQRQRKKPLNRKSQPRTKPIRAKEDLAFSTHKAQNPKIEKSRKPVAVPVPLAQSRSRRVAALVANRKIQGLVESDASEDEEDIESIHKGKSTARPGQTNRTPTSHSSVSLKGSETHANSRPSLMMPKAYDVQIINGHERTTITSASPSVVQSNDENGKARTLDSVGLPTNELVRPAKGVVHDTDTRQRAPVNASDILLPNPHGGQQVQRELPIVKPKILEIQDSASTTNHIHLEEQDPVHDITSEVHSSDHVAALDDTGGSYFEEATAFSHEDTTSQVKNFTDEGTFKASIPDSNSENIHAPNKCEQRKTDDASRVADPFTNSVNSTPKVSIVARLQGALSGVKNLHFSTKTGEKIQDVSKREASTRTGVTTPLFGKTVCDEMTAHETKKATVSSKQASGTDAMQLDQGLIKANRVSFLKKTLQPREVQQGTIEESIPSPITRSSHQTPIPITRVRVSTTTPHALETAVVAETSESDKVTSINKVSLQRVHKAPKSLSLNPDSGRANAKAFKGRLEEQIVSAMRVKNPQHGSQRIPHPQISSVKPINTASKSKSGAFSFKDDIVAEKTPKAPQDSYRKPNVISFDSKGPRNQGIVSSRKMRPIRELEVQEPEMSGTVTDKRPKRTIQDFGEDSFGLVQHDGVVKRPRTSIDVPRTRERFSDKVQKPNISIIKESTKKPSSQSNRVDENGSPLPLEQSRKVGRGTDGLQVLFKTAAQSPFAKKGVDAGNDLLMSRDKVEVSSPGPACLQDLSAPSPLGFRFVPLSCTKHRPSSPNAPSRTIDEYTAHKVDSSGKFVNVRTDNVVVAVRPPDPFVGNQGNRQNSFIELLRRSSNISAQDTSKNAATVHEDPDKTLVTGTGTLAQGKNDCDKALSISSRSSSSSSSDSSQSSKNSSPEGPLSSESGGNEEDDWAAALEPHQSETLEVLLEISHVSPATSLLKMLAGN